MYNAHSYTTGEEIANAITHGIGVLLAIAALVLLVVFSSIYGNATAVVSFTVYGSTLVMLYLMSTIYHSLPRGKAKDVFEILDHSSIFLLIAGTYTPFALVTLKGAKGWTVFGIVWGLALAGMVMKVFLVKKFVILSTLTYILMGWMAIFILKDIMASVPLNGVILLVLGGVAYTVGTFFYIWRKMPYHHAIWHLFVVAGSLFHFFTILIYVR